jgi:hypothetical protein
MKRFMTSASRVALLSIVALIVMTFNVYALTFTFPTQPGDYDNTANAVSGTTPVYNQTTGLDRDIFWWSINNGQPRDGSPDFINQGNSLILSANHAVPGPGPYSAINFTGPSISGGQSYLTIYDKTPLDGNTTKNTFTGTAGDHLILNTDVLFVKHNVSAGIVALYNEGQDGLALLAHNGDGNNADHSRIDLVWQSPGSGTVLLGSVNLPANTFQVAASANGNKTGTDFWYRVMMDLFVSGDTFDITGTFFNHSDPNDPTSPLGTQISAATLHLTGSVSDPDLAALHLMNPGEIGLIVMGNESISLPDNVGVSFFGAPEGEVPEPTTILLLGSGLIGLSGYGRKKFFKK